MAEISDADLDAGRVLRPGDPVLLREAEQGCRHAVVESVKPGKLVSRYRIRF